MSFNISAASGANGLQAMLPSQLAAGPLASLTRGGVPVSYTTQTIKGISYAVFNATSGAYLASYSSGTNNPPVANDASITTNEDTPFSGTLTGSDIDGDPLTFAKATDPAHGTLTVNTNGAFTYTPAANYFGPDSFTFSVNDGHGGLRHRHSDITVNSVNDAPSFTKGPNVTVNEDFGRLLSRLGDRHLARPDQ